MSRPNPRRPSHDFISLGGPRRSLPTRRRSILRTSTRSSATSTTLVTTSPRASCLRRRNQATTSWLHLSAKALGLEVLSNSPTRSSSRLAQLALFCDALVQLYLTLD